MWKTVEYTKKQINDAGRQITTLDLSNEKYQDCLQIIDNWRAAHAFPMNTFAIHLRHLVQNIKGAIVVQRLKRLDTIMGKIQRYPNMALYRMQDVGGCRVILPNIKTVYNIKKRLQSSRIRHELHNEKDYIAIPKQDTGYRGIHLIYKYKSDKRDDFNGLQVEIQLRTRLQHIWATTVETVGMFTDNHLKFNSGSKDWLRFFKLTSALFSVEEKSAIVEGVSTDELEIYSEWVMLLEKLNVVTTLGAIGIATDKIGHIRKRLKNKNGYYLIKLNLKPVNIEIEEFTGVEKSFEMATDAYNKFENEKPNGYVNGVLVSAQSYESLVNAYPNYFLDVKKFLLEIRNLMRKYQDEYEKMLEDL